MTDLPPPKKHLPRWARYVLMALVIAAASLAYYLNNLQIIERLREGSGAP